MKFSTLFSILLALAFSFMASAGPIDSGPDLPGYDTESVISIDKQSINLDYTLAYQTFSTPSECFLMNTSGSTTIDIDCRYLVSLSSHNIFYAGETADVPWYSTTSTAAFLDYSVLTTLNRDLVVIDAAGTRGSPGVLADSKDRASAISIELHS